MSKYYKAPKTYGLYKTGKKQPHKISRSKIDLFLNCKRCFFYDQVLGVSRPPGYPFNLNSAVDRLLKSEFDAYRKKGEQHPLCLENRVPCIPAKHKELDEWRHNFTGVRYHHEKTNFLVFGAIDDLWLDEAEQYVVVDYKATSKDETIIDIDKPWQIAYKRQMEIYQWLLRQNGLPVSNTGYFVYCNGNGRKDAFDARLDFDITVIPYTGSALWVEQTLRDMKELLDDGEIPPLNDDCDYCTYVKALATTSKAHAA